MAKIVNGSLVLDPDDKIDFVDSVGVSHTIYWDDILERFLVNGTLEADQYIGTVNSTVASRNPQPSDDIYEVPTIWVNSTTGRTWLLVSVSAGAAIWKSFGSYYELDHRITINDGSIVPVTVDPYDMWISIGV